MLARLMVGARPVLGFGQNLFAGCACSGRETLYSTKKLGRNRECLHSEISDAHANAAVLKS
jgi:hypothetical protein